VHLASLPLGTVGRQKREQRPVLRHQPITNRPALPLALVAGDFQRDQMFSDFAEQDRSGHQASLKTAPGRLQSGRR
jgi:hypothetical protein